MYFPWNQRFVGYNYWCYAIQYSLSLLGLGDILL
ncbi:uncharacterized protein METZ01_LOCUS39256 [marine metagenome]|uniref:Uncharacterized protein n=1 Tax=marine metagenome TaxID=408172 RepID=A0A381R3X5_9ZZZZ